jgi:hypothetical protein
VRPGKAQPFRQQAAEPQIAARQTERNLDKPGFATPPTLTDSGIGVAFLT